MKTAVYDLPGGEKLAVEYDETAPCIVCGEPVIEASAGGTDICPACDMGICRYCGVQLPWKMSSTERAIKEHIAWHKQERRRGT